MCDCQKTILARLQGFYPNARITNINQEYLSGKTFELFEVETPQGKRTKRDKVNLLHSYCPHCGEKYGT